MPLPAYRPTGSNASVSEEEHRAIGRLTSLVAYVVVQLETPAGQESPVELIPECTAGLEACLEILRHGAERDALARKARDDLKRLGRLLKLVDGADVLFVVRQIQRVLRRFDLRG